eukprot:369197_1
MSVSHSQYLFATSKAIIIFNVICIILSMIHNTLLLLRFIYINIIKKELSDEHTYQMKLYYCTLCTMFGYLLVNTSFLFAELNSFYHLVGCKMILCSIAIYGIAKYLGWFHQIMRLKIVFNDTPLFAYSDTYLRGVCIGLLLVVFIIVTTLCHLAHHVSHAFPVLHCDIIVPIWLGVMCAALDSIASFFCVYLFYSKMKRIWTRESQMSSSERMLWYITRKFIILSVATALSTYILTFFMVFSRLISSVISIDSMVNIWCLTLYDSRCDGLYQNIFKCVSRNDVIDASTADKMNAPDAGDSPETLTDRSCTIMSISFQSKPKSPPSKLTSKSISLNIPYDFLDVIDNGLTGKNIKPEIALHVYKFWCCSYLKLNDDIKQRLDAQIHDKLDRSNLTLPD